MLKIAVILLAGASFLFSQSNTWVKVTGRQVGSWGFPALAYAANTDEFVLTLGQQPSPGVYHIQVFSHALGKWINALPSDTLYGSAATDNALDSAAGKWADSTGTAYGYGYNKGIAGFGWRFGWRTVQGYLRPNTSSDAKALRAYSQFCYNSTDGKIYFFVNNMTFTYAPLTRRWDTLPVHEHPNGTTPYNDAWNGEHFLKWGSICYDAYNHEVVLLGGGGIDQPQGSPGGTWTFSPAANLWTKLDLVEQPGPRAHSPMAYDPVNRKIVLFGGDHLDCLMNETWVYDCVTRTWSKKNPAMRPRPRAGHALVYLPKSGKIVMLGGYRYEANQAAEFEMWTYDVSADAWALVKRFSQGTEWPKLATLNPAYCGLVAADGGDTLVSLTDSTASIYGFSPQTLLMACDPAVTDAGGTATYGVTKDTVALRGTWTNPSWYTDGVAAPDTAAQEAKLRGLVPGTWTLMSPPKAPAGDRTWGTAVLDPDRDLFMRWSGGHAAYCGTDVPQYSIHEDRWTLGYWPEFPMEYDGNNECNPGTITFNSRPFLSGHTRRCYAYDVNLHRMIAVVNWHTYLYNPDSMDWEKGVHIHNAENYSADRGGCVLTTPHGPYGYFNALSHLFSPDSLHWRRLPQAGTLPGWSIDASGAAYDSKRDRIVHTYNSYGNTVNPARLYEYDFSTGAARQLFPQDSALATGGSVYRECVYLPGPDIVLFLFPKGSDLLAYDCAGNRWVTVPVSNTVTSVMNGIGAGMMYDSKRDLVWLTTNASANYALRLDSAALRGELNRKAHEAVALTVSPTPFNPSTTIILPEAGERVLLHVFAADGRCVADLSKQAARSNRVSWQAARLPSGIYVIRLVAGNKTWRTKAVLLK